MVYAILKVAPETGRKREPGNEGTLYLCCYEVSPANSPATVEWHEIFVVKNKVGR